MIFLFISSYFLLALFFVYNSMIKIDPLFSLRSYIDETSQSSIAITVYNSSNMIGRLKNFTEILLINENKDSTQHAIEIYKLMSRIFYRINRGLNTTTNSKILDIYKKIAELYTFRGEPVKSLKYFRKVLAIQRSIYTCDNKVQVAETLRMIGECFDKMGKQYAKKATYYAEKSQEIQNKLESDQIRSCHNQSKPIY